MSSGQDFVPVLKRIGFPKANDLEADCFDWMFDCPETKDFLRWFCHEIDSENLINPNDFLKFEKLVNSGGVILEAEQLEEALSSQGSFKNSTYAEDDLCVVGLNFLSKKELLEKSVRETERRLKEAKQHKNLLLAQRDLLESKSSSVKEKYMKLEKASKLASIELQQESEKLKSIDGRFSRTVQNLVPVVSNFLEFYNEFDSNNNVDITTSLKINPSPVFLSMANFDQFHRLEAQFTRELGIYAKKLLSVDCDLESSERIFDDEEKSLFNPTSDFNKNETLHFGDLSEKLSHHQREELTLIQESHPAEELRYIRAIMKEKESLALKEFLEKILLNLRNPLALPLLPSNLSGLKELESKFSKELAFLSGSINEIFNSELPELIRKSIQLEITRILMKYYEAKVALQDRLLANQDQINEKLVSQKARNKFISLALQTELKDHKSANGLLEMIYKSLDDASTQSKARFDIHAENLAVVTTQSSDILSKERFLHRLNCILSNVPISTVRGNDVKGKQLHLTLRNLQDATTDLSTRFINMQLNDKLLKNLAAENTSVLMKHIWECIQFFPPSLLKSTSEVTGQENDLGPALQMLPRSIIDPMTELDGQLQQLEKTVAEVLKDVEKKKSVLKMDEFLQMERQLYIYFFTNTDLLRREVKNVKSRVLIKQKYTQ